MHKLVYNLNSKSIIPKELGCLVIKQEDDYDVFSGNIEKLAINEINKFYNGEENKCNIYYTNTLYENYIRLWDLESFKFKSTVYHFFRIKCTKFTESVFSLRIFKRHKIWINSNLFCITNPREQFLLVKLKRGVNDIIIETPWAKKEDSFFIRISSYEFEKSAGKFSLFNECLIQPEDIKRVYLLGHSNGASAVFSIAQSYPHYFAGALTISGVCYIDGLCNLKNMKIINVSSKTEANFKLGYERLHKKFLQFKNCTEVLIDNSNHNTMVFMLSSGKIISELIKSKLNPYPDNIEYFTLRNNHRTAYWVKLDKIPLGKQYSKIIAKIIENVIDVKLINSNGVTITIPPQIDKRKFCIKINGKIFEFVSYKKSSITFKKIKNQFAITNEEFDYVDIVKGNGLLTVFFNSLKIITGSNDDEIIKTAKSFAQPKTNATNPDIYVKYPISSNIDDIKTIKSNYIIIESNSSDKELIKIKEKLPVKTYKYGYKYKNRKYYGDYCIMQIIPSPYFDGNYILYVNSNNNDMFDKNVFTRRFTIPTYSKGYHKFLNNIVLIYNEQGYHKIIESGDDIVKIT